MTDLEIKLRTNAALAVSHVPLSENILLHAADEIKKLRGEVAALKLDNTEMMVFVRAATEDRDYFEKARNEVEAERDAAVAFVRKWQKARNLTGAERRKVAIERDAFIAAIDAAKREA